VDQPPRGTAAEAGARRARALRCTLLVAFVQCAACHSEERRLRERHEANAMTTGPEPAALPPGPSPAPIPPGAQPIRAGELGPLYMKNPWAISEGKRLFTWYNCSGCHARGGGGMGPPLMDRLWLYGSSPNQIFASIAGGRPNGMPAWGTRVSEAQIWQLVAFVRSLSRSVPRSALSPRGDEISYRIDAREVPMAVPVQGKEPP
jgi:cytochrome c oxidase cbb3-type subunit 3